MVAYGFNVVQTKMLKTPSFMSSKRCLSQLRASPSLMHKTEFNCTEKSPNFSYIDACFLSHIICLLAPNPSKSRSAAGRTVPKCWGRQFLNSMICDLIIFFSYFYYFFFYSYLNIS